jgi:uncharacterized membrane protein
MKTKLLFLLDLLRTTLWFAPALMAAGATVLALVLVAVDRAAQRDVERLPDWGYSGGPEGARLVLSTIAGSMVTVAGVVFSITIVALTLASSQFGPRLLRAFIRDRSNQIVLGTFLATFLYCLLVLRTIRSDGHGEFVPAISVVVGVLLAIGSLGVLIYFIHHAATSIQATHVIANVTGELLETIDRLYPDQIGEPPESGEPAATPSTQRPKGAGQPVVARRSGYVLALNGEELMHLAREHDLVVRLEVRPGQYLIRDELFATVWSAEALPDDVARELAGAVEQGSERTSLQDLEFGIDQLAEIAVRALSPGINDPFTAMACLDRLGEVLCRLAQREIPSPYRLDQDKRLRVIAPPVSFAQALHVAFGLLRHYARGTPAVMQNMMASIERIARQARRPSDLEALVHEAQRTRDAGLAAIDSPPQREQLEERLLEIVAMAKSPPSPLPSVK